jgi:alcohol dehydrogenase class IV
MKAFTFQAPPNILFEAGASSKLAETVGTYGVERVLLVTARAAHRARYGVRSTDHLHYRRRPSALPSPRAVLSTDY